MKTEKQILEETYLPKWPAMTVVGEKVTPKQAAEIIFRTDCYIRHPSSNTKHYDKEFCKVLNYIYDDYSLEGKDCGDYLDRKDDFLKEKIKTIELEYLYNARICSSYIGGPHGWCDWNGNVFQNTGNIGKHPCVEEVLQEWKNIAIAFPYLKLRCQLYNREYSEENKKPVIEYVVSDGKANVKEPEETIESYDNLDDNKLLSRFTNPFAEIGIQTKQLKEKLIEVYGEIPRMEDHSYDLKRVN